MKRMHASERRSRFFEQTHQEGDGGFILSLVKEARGCITVPTVRMFKCGHQLLYRGFAESRQLRLLESIRHNAIDAATIIACIQIEQLLDRIRQRPWMLDDLAIHIGDVEGAIRSISQLNGAEPEIGRS